MTEPSTRTRSERWNNPLTIAIVAAALAGFSNAYIAYANNEAQLELETRRAESERILEVLKVGEPDRVRENLRFLLQLGLVQNEELVRRIQGWEADPNRGPLYLSVERRRAAFRRANQAGRAQPANDEPPASQADPAGY